MAIINNQNQQDPTQPTDNTANSTAVPTYQNTPNASQGRASQTGTGFTNLSRVLNANKNNQLGSVVSSGVNSQVDSAKTGIQNGLASFQDDANKGRLDTAENTQKRDTTIANADQATDQDADQFNTFRAGAYNGPTELANKTQLTNQAQQASTLGSMAGTAEGRQGLLQRFAGGAGYNQGAQRLDSMLLGQSGNGDLKSAYRDARGLNQQVDSANTTAEEQAKQIAAQNAAFGTATKGLLNNSVNSIYDTGEGRVNDWTNDQTNLINGITTAGAYNAGDNGNVNLTQAQADALTKGGLDLNNPYIYNANLGDLISKSGYNPTLNAAVTAQEAAKAKGLGKLSGSDLSDNGQNLLANLSDPTQYGTLADQSKITASQAGLDQDRAAAQEAALRQYYNTGINQNSTYMGGSFNINPFASSDDYINQVKSGGNQNTAMYGVNQANLSSISPYQNAGGVQAVQDTLNTGGDYSSKTALEQALDAARAGDTASSNSIYAGNLGTSTTAGTDAANSYGRLRKILVGG